MEEVKVISIAVKKREGLPKRLSPQRQKAFCPHYQVIADQETRQVYCERCGAILDPFEFIYRSACMEDCHFSNLSMIKVEIKKLQEQQQELTKQINNLKSQRRRLL